MSLNERIKQIAYDLGADLVGFGGIDRCVHAPLMMSPQGLMPTARTVVVMAIHHPDACIELGGESHPQKIGPYSLQYQMNARLDEMSYRLASAIERLGGQALPIVSSNIWRYNEYKDLDAVFAPDVSHIYMAVVAGLAEIGYSGLAITPEYGARNRFVTVITDIECEPDPLIKPGTVCDHCMLCRTHCPTNALSTELDGENVLRIGPYEYRWPKKNLWRCAWAEHFDLDLDLEIPEKVTEEVILDTARTNGLRSGEMGQCLKFCLPAPLRTFDRDVSRTPMRRYDANPDSACRADIDRALSHPLARGADRLMVFTAEELRGREVDLEAVLPGAASAVMLLVDADLDQADPSFAHGARYQIDSLCYDLTRDLEALGARTLTSPEHAGSNLDSKMPVNVSGRILAGLPDLAGRDLAVNTVVTRLAIAPQQRCSIRPVGPDAGNARADVSTALASLAESLGADVCGVAPAQRVAGLADQLRPLFQGQRILDAEDRSARFSDNQPELSEHLRQVKSPEDWLDGATSVFVFGLRYHRAVLQWATRPPAEAVGPYSFETYVTHWLGCQIGYQLVRQLQASGYRAVLTPDLTNTASLTATPRGPQPDLFANRFAGIAAGLGWLTTSGHLCTPQFGLAQRVMAVVTDAPLSACRPIMPPAGQNPCSACEQPCLTACPSRAFTDQRAELTCDGCQYHFVLTDPRKCDWSKRYALTAQSGFGYLGSPADVQPPDDVTPEALAEAMTQHDPIKKYRPAIAEPCVMRCPLRLR